MTERRNSRRSMPSDIGYAWTALEGLDRRARTRRNVRRPRTRRRRPSRSGNIKLYLTLTLVCFLIAIAWVFVTGKGPEMIRAAIKREIQATISAEGDRLKEELKKELSDEDIQKLKRQYEKYRK